MRQGLSLSLVLLLSPTCTECQIHLVLLYKRERIDRLSAAILLLVVAVVVRDPHQFFSDKKLIIDHVLIFAGVYSAREISATDTGLLGLC